MSGADGGEMTGLHSFTIGDLGVFIGTLGSVVTGILVVLQHSRCKRIKLCCCECDRDVENLPLDKVKKGPVAQANEEIDKLTREKNKPTTVVEDIKEVIKDAEGEGV
tara:strand:- start:667 stop:987 length:321 start_codon:yes stop_codon:yes gene_type:complete